MKVSLPPHYFDSIHYWSHLTSCRAALDRAAVLLKMSLGGLRIDNHWGTGGGLRPVTQLIKEVTIRCQKTYVRVIVVRPLGMRMLSLS